MLKNSVIVIGAGRFGKRAVRLLSSSSRPVAVVDKDPAALDSIGRQAAISIVADGVSFLKERLGDLDQETLIVPALPVHLAYEWLACGAAGGFKLEKTHVPEGLAPDVVFSWPAGDGSLLVSYSNFMCPDDCPEGEFCTVTGERRDMPLYRLLQNQNVRGWATAVLRSLQLAPGLGGYRAGDLYALAARVMDAPEERCLVCTSCSCHGVITACRKIPAG